MKNLPQFKNSIKMLNNFLDLGCRGYALLFPHRLQPGPKQINLEKIESILVIQLYALGDVLLSLPLLKGLRSAYPKGKIDFCIGKNWLKLKPCLPYIDRIIAADSRNAFKTLSILKNLYKRHYDLAFVLYPVLAGSWLSFLVGAQYRIGYTRDFDNRESLGKASSSLLTHPVTLGHQTVHDTQRYRALADHIGLSLKWEPPFLYPPPMAESFIQRVFRHRLLDKARFLIGMNPNASWEGKRWPSFKFAQLADLLIQDMNAQVVFFGSPAERKYTEEIIALMKYKPLWPGPTSLIEMASLIRHCHLFISNDSGPMHMSCALDVPTLAVMGHSRIDMFQPWASISRFIQNPLPCAPCQQIKANQCRHFSCIRSISVDSVFTAAGEMLFL